MLTELKGGIDKLTMILKEFNISFSRVDRTSRPNKISKEIETGTAQLWDLVPPSGIPTYVVSYQC